jgi:hypothetical protein
MDVNIEYATWTNLIIVTVVMTITVQTRLKYTRRYHIMNTRFMTIALAGFVAGSILSMPVFVYAASSTGPGRTPGINEIKNREGIQSQRFEQGVNSGAINSTTAAQDIAARQQLNSTLQSEVQANNGHLTAEEVLQTNQRLNNASKTLYQQKH